jgi:hypothetical protein
LEKPTPVPPKKESKPVPEAPEGERRASRKRAADFFEDKQESIPTPPLKKSKSKAKTAEDSELGHEKDLGRATKKEVNKQKPPKTSEGGVRGHGQTTSSSNGVGLQKEASKLNGSKSKQSKRPPVISSNAISDSEVTSEHKGDVDEVTEEEQKPLNNEELLDIALYGFTSSEDSSGESDEDKVSEKDLPKPPHVSETARQEVAANRKGKENDNGVGVLYIGCVSV